MNPLNAHSAANLRGHPLPAMLAPISIACFLGTLLLDLLYWDSAAVMWANIAAWLLIIGIIVSVFAVTARFIDLLKDARIRRLRAAWVQAIGNNVALLLSIINAMVHARDGYTSVVPLGLILSALVVTILMLTAWHGWILANRHSVGVHDQGSV